MRFNYLRTVAKRLIPRRLHPVRFQLARMARASRKRRSILGPYATAILTEGYNGKLLVAATDTAVGRHLTLHGSYDRREIEFHLRHLNTESEVLFVGAHVGSLLVPIARRVRNVVGIEANPQTFALLEQNIGLNALENVELHQVAAGDREDEIEFVMHTHNTGNSLIKQGKVDEHDPIWGYDKPTVVRAKMRRLDQLLGARSFDLIVVDIEGSEYLALQGMPGLLERAQRLSIEIVPYFVENVAAARPEQVFELLAPYFDRAWTLEDAMNSSPGVSVDAIAKAFVAAGQGADVYFEKTPVVAAVDVSASSS